MNIRKLDDGTLLVPKRIESESTIGDGMQEIKPHDPEYDNYLRQYNKEQYLKKEEIWQIGKIC